MFTKEDMRALLSARPFVPFRLWLDNGEHLDVFRANQVMLVGTLRYRWLA
jgi:hypothetical protein